MVTNVTVGIVVPAMYAHNFINHRVYIPIDPTSLQELSPQTPASVEVLLIGARLHPETGRIALEVAAPGVSMVVFVEADTEIRAAVQ